jgi:capsular exopolysaccharide synthesis family protein
LLLRRKWEVLLVACLVILPVAVATYFAPRLHRSIAQVQIASEPVQVLPYRDIDLPQFAPNYEFFMRTQEQILRGSAVVARVQERVRTDPELQSEVGRVAGNLAIQRLEGTQIFSLGYVAPDPVVAARVANLYAEEYMRQHFESRQEVRESAREFLQRELDGLEQRVQQSEKQLVAYAQEHGIPVDSSGLSLAQRRLDMLSGLASQAESERLVTQTRLETLENAEADELLRPLDNGVISGLVAKLVQLEADLTVLRTRFGENWPAVVQKRTEIELAEQQLQRERAAALTSTRDQARLDYTTAEVRDRRLAAALAEQKELVNQQERARISYDIIRREVETNRNSYEALLERLKQTSMTAGMEFGGISVINPALPSYRVDSPRVAWNLFLASVLGLVLGVCVALVRDLGNASILTVDELERLTTLPMLGTVPHVEALAPATSLLNRAGTRVAIAARRALRRADSVESEPARSLARPGPGRLAAHPMASEAVRNICASILLSRSGRPPRVLMVTSSIAGEGKTTLATELALALAEIGARTLLVECDMRRPTFGSIFGIGEERGLSLFLSGHVGPTPAIHPTENGNLFVVSAGPPVPNPPALLNSEKLQSFISSMTSSYAFIVLDAPPALAVADARVLAPMAEGVILTARAGLASKKGIRRACAALRHTNVLGVVLNGVQTPDFGYGDYGYYAEYRRV